MWLHDLDFVSFTLLIKEKEVVTDGLFQSQFAVDNNSTARRCRTTERTFSSEQGEGRFVVFVRVWGGRSSEGTIRNQMRFVVRSAFGAMFFFIVLRVYTTSDFTEARASC